MNYSIADLFVNTEILFTNLVNKESVNNLSLQNQLVEARYFYNNLKVQANSIDATLDEYI